MILSGKEIKRRLGTDIFIDDFDDSRLNPNSYNLRLDNKLAVYESSILNMRADNKIKEFEIPETGFRMTPGTLYLGKTKEHTYTKNLVPMLEGRSSVGRLGVSIHVTAGFGDVGFNGFWTLELYCIQPVIIYPYVDICQIYYHTIEGDFDTYDSGKYQNNTGIQASRMYLDFK